jgi:hypothetical protein
MYSSSESEKDQEENNVDDEEEEVAAEPEVDKGKANTVKNPPLPDPP